MDAGEKWLKLGTDYQVFFVTSIAFVPADLLIVAPMTVKQSSFEEM